MNLHLSIWIRFSAVFRLIVPSFDQLIDRSIDQSIVRYRSFVCFSLHFHFRFCFVLFFGSTRCLLRLLFISLSSPRETTVLTTEMLLLTAETIILTAETIVLTAETIAFTAKNRTEMKHLNSIRTVSYSLPFRIIFKSFNHLSFRFQFRFVSFFGSTCYLLRPLYHIF